jgi:pyruvate/2-oxoglutarate/acetoin dehydrogenase E1 component
VSERSYSEAVRAALREELKRDRSVFLIGEDIAQHGGAFGVTRGLYEEFGPDRVINTPISEAAIVAAAIGAALAGCRPVAEIMYMDFISVAMSQIVNQMAKMRYMFGGKARIPAVVRTPAGAGRGNAAQHMQSLEAWFVHVPGLIVAMPATPYDAKGLLKTAIRSDDPVIFIEHKLLYATKGQVNEEDYLIPFGVADIKREGNDVTVIATSRMVVFALKAAEALAGEGIDVEVIDPRTLVPFDIATVQDSVRKTGHVVVVHEACERCGIGAEIVAQIQEKVFDYLDSPILRVANPNVPIPFAANLETAAIPDQRRIMEAVRRSLGLVQSRGG